MTISNEVLITTMSYGNCDLCWQSTDLLTLKSKKTGAHLIV